MTDPFDPLTLRGLTLNNRLWVPAMCMYSVDAGDGVPTDFHLAHYSARVAGGFGLIITEATAIHPAGRISPADTGLWSDAQAAAWARIVDQAHRLGGAIGVQLAHAGRKASTRPMRPGGPDGALPVADGGWETLGPSASAFPGLAVPHELTRDEIAGIVRDFADAATRAAASGFDVIELHAAHGYLLHQFLSPLANTRTDAYGGSLENRLRLTLEVTDAVRAVWPDGRPLFVRISATDWVEGGWDVEQSCALASELAARGVDLIDVSSGGVAPASIPVGPGYQVELARQVRATGMPTAAVGLITTVAQASEIIGSGAADAVLFGREALRNPYLPVQALAARGGDAAGLAPVPYVRAWPSAS
ncbi:NADH:flavin oxidoreductase/NADH oxidase [Propioniciclava tarda]|uniref:NADH:flavin oxidoreductase/NADH oxidase n=1 Tax=Propioniciclava tarda TaxID=433330 RepID=A0A4Q9KLU7_PROTD|nr:NADH:flavin oxidoreductase/NADH oxidase [Propioniciclava tarda]TBT95507.1 NADH:flavin oxidoreductase/NADH oxidase [Propioniciclava tarda]SMO50332.1 2,4-dienoyl-CoA reductase [Propioniciclava tarda]HQA30396.1 NADH:flavin oxidoreductase/NADH oxidase [Propioniciclava tarda]